ncbi:hypothetical protein BLNAU_12292 [Blattamonas nauphoetae]|uniref:Mon2/Sec7/BIG1-like dimerisation and cyclophilin-binding domain-containing protein n=1 Tax=Blattamonas nauphoetae TaxID=2049346 RepID=A0ABQ9XPU6_9EUKA|nr:hypothetical protein BLNAU_12292 [Blattamonas nauphoetae]
MSSTVVQKLIQLFERLQSVTKSHDNLLKEREKHALSYLSSVKDLPNDQVIKDLSENKMLVSILISAAESDRMKMCLCALEIIQLMSTDGLFSTTLITTVLADSIPRIIKNNKEDEAVLSLVIRICSAFISPPNSLSGMNLNKILVFPFRLLSHKSAKVSSLATATVRYVVVNIVEKFVALSRHVALESKGSQNSLSASGAEAPPSPSQAELSQLGLSCYILFREIVDMTFGGYCRLTLPLTYALLDKKAPTQQPQSSYCSPVFHADTFKDTFGWELMSVFVNDDFFQAIHHPSLHSIKRFVLEVVQDQLFPALLDILGVDPSFVKTLISTAVDIAKDTAAEFPLLSSTSQFFTQMSSGKDAFGTLPASSLVSLSATTDGSTESLLHQATLSSLFFGRLASVCIIQLTQTSAHNPSEKDKPDPLKSASAFTTDPLSFTKYAARSISSQSPISFASPIPSKSSQVLFDDRLALSVASTSLLHQFQHAPKHLVKLSHLPKDTPREMDTIFPLLFPLIHSVLKLSIVDLSFHSALLLFVVASNSLASPHLAERSAALRVVRELFTDTDWLQTAFLLWEPRLSLEMCASPPQEIQPEMLSDAGKLFKYLNGLLTHTSSMISTSVFYEVITTPSKHVMSLLSIDPQFDSNPNGQISSTGVTTAPQSQLSIVSTFPSFVQPESFQVGPLIRSYDIQAMLNPTEEYLLKIVVDALFTLTRTLTSLTIPPSPPSPEPLSTESNILSGHSRSFLAISLSQLSVALLFLSQSSIIHSSFPSSAPTPSSSSTPFTSSLFLNALAALFAVSRSSALSNLDHIHSMSFLGIASAALPSSFLLFFGNVLRPSSKLVQYNTTSAPSLFRAPVFFHRNEEQPQPLAFPSFSLRYSNMIAFDTLFMFVDVNSHLLTQTSWDILVNVLVDSERHIAQLASSQQVSPNLTSQTPSQLLLQHIHHLFQTSSSLENTTFSLFLSPLLIFANLYANETVKPKPKADSSQQLQRGKPVHALSPVLFVPSSTSKLKQMALASNRIVESKLAPSDPHERFINQLKGSAGATSAWFTLTPSKKESRSRHRFASSLSGSKADELTSKQTLKPNSQTTFVSPMNAAPTLSGTTSIAPTSTLPQNQASSLSPISSEQPQAVVLPVHCLADPVPSLVFETKYSLFTLPTRPLPALTPLFTSTFSTLVTASTNSQIALLLSSPHASVPFTIHPLILPAEVDISLPSSLIQFYLPFSMLLNVIRANIFRFTLLGPHVTSILSLSSIPADPSAQTLSDDPAEKVLIDVYLFLLSLLLSFEASQSFLVLFNHSSNQGLVEKEKLSILQDTSESTSPTLSSEKDIQAHLDSIPLSRFLRPSGLVHDEHLPLSFPSITKMKTAGIMFNHKDITDLLSSFCHLLSSSSPATKLSIYHSLSLLVQAWGFSLTSQDWVVIFSAINKSMQLLSQVALKQRRKPGAEIVEQRELSESDVVQAAFELITLIFENHLVSLPTDFRFNISHLISAEASIPISQHPESSPFGPVAQMLLPSTGDIIKAAKDRMSEEESGTPISQLSAKAESIFILPSFSLSYLGTITAFQTLTAYSKQKDNLNLALSAVGLMFDAIESMVEVGEIHTSVIDAHTTTKDVNRMDRYEFSKLSGFWVDRPDPSCIECDYCRIAHSAHIAQSNRTSHPAKQGTTLSPEGGKQPLSRTAESPETTRESQSSLPFTNTPLEGEGASSSVKFCRTVQSIVTSLSMFIETIASFALDLRFEVRTMSLARLGTLLRTHSRFFTFTSLAPVTITEFLLPTAQAMWMETLLSASTQTKAQNTPDKQVIVHHSQNTPQKQWEQSLIQMTITIVDLLCIFNQSFASITSSSESVADKLRVNEALIPSLKTFLLNILIHGKEEVAYAGVYALSEILEITFETIQSESCDMSSPPKGQSESFSKKLWDMAWQVINGFAHSVVECPHSQSVLSVSSLSVSHFGSLETLLDSLIEPSSNLHLSIGNRSCSLCIRAHQKVMRLCFLLLLWVPHDASTVARDFDSLMNQDTIPEVRDDMPFDEVDDPSACLPTALDPLTIYPVTPLTVSLSPAGSSALRMRVNSVEPNTLNTIFYVSNRLLPIGRNSPHPLQYKHGKERIQIPFHKLSYSLVNPLLFLAASSLSDLPLFRSVSHTIQSFTDHIHHVDRSGVILDDDEDEVEPGEDTDEEVDDETVFSTTQPSTPLSSHSSLSTPSSLRNLMITSTLLALSLSPLSFVAYNPSVSIDVSPVTSAPLQITRSSLNHPSAIPSQMTLKAPLLLHPAICSVSLFSPSTRMLAQRDLMAVKTPFIHLSTFHTILFSALHLHSLSVQRHPHSEEELTSSWRIVFKCLILLLDHGLQTIVQLEEVFNEEFWTGIHSPDRVDQDQKTDSILSVQSEDSLEKDDEDILHEDMFEVGESPDDRSTPSHLLHRPHLRRTHLSTPPLSRTNTNPHSLKDSSKSLTTAESPPLPQKSSMSITTSTSPLHNITPTHPITTPILQHSSDSTPASSYPGHFAPIPPHPFIPTVTDPVVRNPSPMNLLSDKADYIQAESNLFFSHYAIACKYLALCLETITVLLRFAPLSVVAPLIHPIIRRLASFFPPPSVSVLFTAHPLSSAITSLLIALVNCSVTSEDVSVQESLVSVFHLLFTILPRAFPNPFKATVTPSFTSQFLSIHDKILTVRSEISLLRDSQTVARFVDAEETEDSRQQMDAINVWRLVRARMLVEWEQKNNQLHTTKLDDLTTFDILRMKINQKLLKPTDLTIFLQSQIRQEQRFSPLTAPQTPPTEEFPLSLQFAHVFPSMSSLCVSPSGIVKRVFSAMSNWIEVIGEMKGSVLHNSRSFDYVKLRGKNIPHIFAALRKNYSFHGSLFLSLLHSLFFASTFSIPSLLPQAIDIFYPTQFFPLQQTLPLSPLPLEPDISFIALRTLFSLISSPSLLPYSTSLSSSFSSLLENFLNHPQIPLTFLLQLLASIIEQFPRLESSILVIFIPLTRILTRLSSRTADTSSTEVVPSPCSSFNTTCLVINHIAALLRMIGSSSLGVS